MLQYIQVRRQHLRRLELPGESDADEGPPPLHARPDIGESMSSWGEAAEHSMRGMGS